MTDTPEANDMERRGALALATCYADAIEEHGEPPSHLEMARAVINVLSLASTMRERWNVCGRR
jgi:hypothetical protein